MMLYFWTNIWHILWIKWNISHYFTKNMFYWFCSMMGYNPKIATWMRQIMIIQLGIGAPRLPNVMEGGKIMKHIWSLFRNKVQAMAGFCFVLLSWRWISLVDLPMIGLCRSWSVAWFEFLEVLERLNMTTAFTPQTKDVDGWMKSCFSLELECLGRYFFSTCDHVCEIFRGIVCTMNPENWEDMPLFWIRRELILWRIC